MNVDLLLAHHPPSQYARCLRVGDRHILDGHRCSHGAHHCSPHLPSSLLLNETVRIDWRTQSTSFGALAYRPLRQIALTVVAAPALGRGLARNLLHPGDRLFWTMALLFGGTCALVLYVTRGENVRG